MDKPLILVVDDEEEILEMLELRLKAKGYDVLSFHSAREALGLLDKKKPDLILLDLLMPEMDGWEFCKALRLKVAHQDTPVIVLTASQGLDLEEKIAQAGVSAYLQKPYDDSVLLQMIQEYCVPH